MIVTQPSNQPTVRRHVGGTGVAVRHGVRPAGGPARRLSSPAIAPFRPDPHGGITVRTWHGPADLAEFSRGLPTVVPDPSRFHVQSRSARFGEFDVTYMAHTPLRWGPTSRDFGHTTATVRIVVVLEGEVTLRHGDGAAVLNRRDGAVVLGWQPVVYETREPARIITCDVPASNSAAAAMPTHVPFTIGKADSVLLPALAAFLCDLLRHDRETLVPAVRAQVTETLDALVSGVLSTLTVSDDSDWNRRSQRMRAMRYISSHYADPQLSPATLAERLGISKRSLQRLFESEDAGVAQCIHNKRLEHALARLRDPRYAGTSLEDLAVLTGFGNALTLRRAVHAATGRPPSQIRAEAAAGAADAG